MRVPFVDLGAQYRAHKGEIDAAIAAVIDASAFIGGSHVRDFESAFARAAGAKHCVACANGTDAIYILLRMLGIGAGDEVITTAMSWISTSETITQAGATPVFVDVDDCFGIDPDGVERKITVRTKAIIPVHLYGQPVDMGRVLEIAKRHSLVVIEDCAQAHLATFAGQPVGTMGHAGTFSFYPGKNLGAYGDAGAMITADADLAGRIRMYANHGALVKHQHEIEGVNSRLDGLQAAILAAKLRHLSDWTRERQRVADRYGRGLAGVVGIEPPRVRPSATHVYHLYVVRAQRREALRAYLSAAGVETQIHYPRPLPLMPCYSRMGHVAADFPRAAAAQPEILSLPIFAEMSDAQVDYVCESIRAFYRSGG